MTTRAAHGGTRSAEREGSPLWPAFIFQTGDLRNQCTVRLYRHCITLEIHRLRRCSSGYGIPVLTLKMKTAETMGAR